MRYKLFKDDDLNIENILVLSEDGVNIKSIPLDPDNTDYQEYLEWVADGGVPEPADTPEEAE